MELSWKAENSLLTNPDQKSKTTIRSHQAVFGQPFLFLKNKKNFYLPLQIERESMEEVLKLFAKLDSVLQTYFQSVQEHKIKWTEEKAFFIETIEKFQQQLLMNTSIQSARPPVLNREEIKSLIQDIDTCLTYLKEE